MDVPALRRSRPRSRPGARSSGRPPRRPIHTAPTLRHEHLDALDRDGGNDRQVRALGALRRLGTSQATAAPRWRRLPLTITSVWSAARLRMLGVPTIVAPSAMGWASTLNDGTASRRRSSMSVPRRRCSRSPPTTVTGDSTRRRRSQRGAYRPRPLRWPRRPARRIRPEPGGHWTAGTRIRAEASLGTQHSGTRASGPRRTLDSGVSRLAHLRSTLAGGSADDNRVHAPCWQRWNCPV